MRFEEQNDTENESFSAVNLTSARQISLILAGAHAFVSVFDASSKI
ncbi:hypothetical protein QBK93_32575 [Rhizobium leguminosarum]|nr:hypothetical protein [Rhizobium leguminosarum]